jgi:hypothetical protein
MDHRDQMRKRITGRRPKRAAGNRASDRRLPFCRSTIRAWKATTAAVIRKKL